MTAGKRTPRELLLLVAGFILWSSAFVILYSVQALGCRLGWDEVGFGPVTLNRGVLLAVWAVHLCLIGLLAAALMRRRASMDPAPFIDRAGLALTFCALAATIWIGFPILAARSTCS
jgi:hypothetical protein